MKEVGESINKLKSDQFKEDFGISVDEAERLFRDVNHPAIRMLVYLHEQNLQALIHENSLEDDGYRIQGAVRLLDWILDIPDMLKDLQP